ncbi:hypothetical protein IF651_09815 [Cellulosimicrobium arenosum]|uniref:Uncharacterized protein n=1 Tax=Cellulosimicrobium arenosum TaxID=2708133 RepID=A0A927G9B4_9MICO|nr:hypothetical protein [Cellulosimicrobium arenosum]
MRTRIIVRFLPILGPAQISRLDADGRGVSELERERERALRTSFERVTGPDGRSYVVSPTEPSSVGRTPRQHG